MTEHEAREQLLRAIEATGGQRAFAHAHGFSVAYVNDVVRGKRDLADRILATIGIKRVVTYQVSYEPVPNNSQKDSHHTTPQE
jgi:DNA-binding transcriptional regulator YdaS (Cro superfamily)